MRMNETRTVKKIFEEKLGERRGRGRPRLRWIDDVEDDLRSMGTKRWRIKALDRVEWASIIKEPKVKLKVRSATGRRRRQLCVLQKILDATNTEKESLRNLTTPSIRLDNTGKADMFS
jgi:hypothetical protein